MRTGLRLDRWFKRRLPTLSLSHLNKIVRTGQVRVDGARATTSTRLVTGQKIRVPPVNVVPPAPKPAFNEADRNGIRDMILYEDQDLMVLNKPYGLAVQGGSGTKYHVDGNAGLARGRKGRAPGARASARPRYGGRLAHRQIASRCREARGDFRSRQAKKIYWALVEGVPKPAQGRISLFLAKGRGHGRSARSQIAKRARQSREDADRQAWRC